MSRKHSSQNLSKCFLTKFGTTSNVWPRGRAAGRSRVTRSNDNTKLVAANGTEIKNFGVRQVAFKGVKVPSENDESTDFVGQA